MARPRLAIGFSRVCHLRWLAEREREAIEELEAQRVLWTARQQLRRARDRTSGCREASLRPAQFDLQ